MERKHSFDPELARVSYGEERPEPWTIPNIDHLDMEALIAKGRRERAKEAARLMDGFGAWLRRLAN